MNRKILIVDDDENILILYSRALQKHNYETATLTSTEYLLDIVKENKPDLIIMDIWIPDIGGEAAAELLKNDLNTFEIPIIFASSNADTDVIAFKVGVEGFLNKPFESKELVNKIEEIIDAKMFTRV